MKVYLNEINGLWDAINAMYFSKRSWTREKEKHLMELYSEYYDRWGKMIKEPDGEMLDLMNKLFKWSKSHITLGKFLDFSFTVEGLHRGAQDDFDSHAKRLDNRIIRSSTRLATFGNEKSEWYEGKILTTDEALDFLDIDIPEQITVDGVNYVRATNGYIREGLEKKRDIIRGLYMLSIPSNFTFKCNCTEFAHIVNERDWCSNAHEELKAMIELCKGKLHLHIPQLTNEFYRSVKN